MIYQIHTLHIPLRTFALPRCLIRSHQQTNHCASSPPQILLRNKVIHKHLRQQRIRLILQKQSAHIPRPTFTNSPPSPNHRPRSLPSQPPTLTFKLSCVGSASNFLLASSSRNTTTNPRSHSLSLLTPVSASGVSSGRPPFGFSRMRSGCCSYRDRKARARSPFWAEVTLGRKLKVAMCDVC